MSDTVKVRYIGHSANGIEHPVTGEVVAHGHQTEVPAEVAGKAPRGDDPGFGLLAQTDEWEKVTPPAKKAAKKAAKQADDVPEEPVEIAESSAFGANEGDVTYG